jgi:hypothetical protein
LLFVVLLLLHLLPCHHFSVRAKTFIIGPQRWHAGCTLPSGFNSVYSLTSALKTLSWPACRYELHHGVRISDSALVDAAVLSDRYIADRFLPDKAIDLVDEAAAKLKMEITSKPLKLDEIDRKILQLEMERLSLSKVSQGFWLMG